MSTQREKPEIAGARIMLVEDEVILALDLSMTLEEAGAAVVGPFHRLSEAQSYARVDALDAAILDIDVRGRDVFPLADRLRDAGVPILFHTARTRVDTQRFPRSAVCRKPCGAHRLLPALEALMRRDGRIPPNKAAAR